MRREESLDSAWDWKPGLATPSCTSYREENAKQLETLALKKAVLTHSYGSFTLKMDDVIFYQNLRRLYQNTVILISMYVITGNVTFRYVRYYCITEEFSLLTLSDALYVFVLGVTAPQWARAS